MYNLIKTIQRLPTRGLQCCCRLSSSGLPQKQENSITETKKYDPRDVTKEDMKWRTPWHREDGEYYTLLRSFASEKSKVATLKWLQTPIDFSPSNMKKWWAKKMELRDIMMQSYIPQRHQTLGNELAAAHFLVHRGGAVKFYGENEWIKANEYNEYDLPRFYEEDKILEAIDCADMRLYYEGLTNLRGLKKLEWLSLNSCILTDDWFLDKITNIFRHSLVYLDLRHCPKYTERGLGALYKMEKLKILYIDDMLMTSSFEMTCLMLQEVNPHLDIRIGDE